MSRLQRGGLTIVSIFAVIASLGEIAVSIRGNYPGILFRGIRPSFSRSVIGSLFSLGGLSLLTMKKWGAVLGIVFITAEIFGGVYVVMAGVVPSQGGDVVKILAGGAFTLVVILSVGFQWK
jgi:hypothetical protein